jgi:hypothetical protein
MARYYKEEGSGMISNDTSKMSNLPTEVMVKPYAGTYEYLTESYNDKISGLDEEIKANESKRNSGMKPQRY